MRYAYAPRLIFTWASLFVLCTYGTGLCSDTMAIENKSWSESLLGWGGVFPWYLISETCRLRDLQTLCCYFVFPFVVFAERAAEPAEDGVEPTTKETGVTGDGTPEDLVAWFNSTIEDYDAFFLVYYRGLWWPYCKVCWVHNVCWFLWFHYFTRCHHNNFPWSTPYGYMYQKEECACVLHWHGYRLLYAGWHWSNTCSTQCACNSVF